MNLNEIHLVPRIRAKMINYNYIIPISNIENYFLASWKIVLRSG